MESRLDDFGDLFIAQFVWIIALIYEPPAEDFAGTGKDRIEPVIPFAAFCPRLAEALPDMPGALVVESLFDELVDGGAPFVAHLPAVGVGIIEVDGLAVKFGGFGDVV